MNIAGIYPSDGVFLMHVDIGGKRVGDGNPCFIIAEAGINHNGSLETALKMVDAAAAAGADAVKFQFFQAERMYVKDSGTMSHVGGKSIYDIVKGYEVPHGWFEALHAKCRDSGIVFFASVFDSEIADAVDRFMPAFKVASYELNHLPLLAHLAKKGKPMIISTGACSVEEIREAVETVRANGCDRICLMQCTAKYPAPNGSLNIRTIQWIKREFGVPVGLSDHSEDPVIAPVVAVSLGANLIEKHFTLDKNMGGPDHKFAVNPAELKLLVESVRKAEEAMGSGEKRVLEEETELHKFAKRAVHAVRDINKGEVFTEENIQVLRSGNRERGLPPSQYAHILGNRAKRDIGHGKGVTKEDF